MNAARGPPRSLFLAFFFSGAAGLVYQVIWVRHFGNLFGNTSHSAALVTAVFMLGLGLGSFLAGRWVDGAGARDRGVPLRMYVGAELFIGAWALGLSLLLPRLSSVADLGTSYSVGAHGWLELSGGTYVVRYLVATALLLPITAAMGATLTFLVRWVVAQHVSEAGWKVGVLYGANTGGAALGAFLTDFVLVPSIGQFATLAVAVLLNFTAALLASRLTKVRADDVTTPPRALPVPLRPAAEARARALRVTLTIFASGFAAMGIELAWLRYFTVSLGGLRAVFSMLLTVMLVAMWAGSVAGGAAHRRWGRASQIFRLAQVGLVVSTLLLLATHDAAGADAYFQRELLASFTASGELGRRAIETWWHLRTLALVVGPPAFFMGFAYPLANALVQDAESSIGRRAGALYLANTVGAVAGALVTGFVLIPRIGTQSAVGVLAGVAAVAVLAVPKAAGERGGGPVLAGGLVVAGLALALWQRLPAHSLVLSRAAPGATKLKPYTLLTASEGVYETIAVTEEPDGSRRLNTNGHSMSSTDSSSRRYMRLFAHVPLLHQEAPRSALVICFGVGNTSRAAAMHPSLQRLDVVDLSRHVLEHAPYFQRWNEGVLEDPRTHVYVEDGRSHLRLQPPGTYDLVTLEPPPIGFAGVASLYSREFYQLAQSRLADGGFVTQWLPAYQVPPATTLAIIRAFIDVFPGAILLHGAPRELILVGRRGAPLQLDLDALARRLEERPLVKQDLASIQVGDLTDFVGLFAAGSGTLTEATRGSDPITDDFPSMEYSVFTNAVDNPLPPTIFAPWEAFEWCPRCRVGGQLDARVAGLDAYLAIMGGLYRSGGFLQTALPSDGAAATEIVFPKGVTPQSDVVQRSPWLRSLFPSARATPSER